MDSRSRALALAGALFAALGVAAGAFGAHALRDLVPASDLAVWDTAVRYQLFHALALLLLGLSGGVRLHFAGVFIALGTVVFSGSLYLLVLTDTRWLGAITPIGGVLLIVGWLVCAWKLWSREAD